jgi:hypothetical protein
MIKEIRKQTEKKEERGQQAGNVAIKLRSKFISPTKKFKQGFKSINTLSSPPHLSG